jgi:hypothetical protein
VDRDIRLLAAQGALAPRAHEQLALLMLLVSDADAEIAAAAEATLTAIPRGSLESFLARSDVTPQMRAFFAERGIQPAEVARDDDAPMIEVVDEGLAGPDPSGAVEPPPDLGSIPSEEGEDEEQKRSVTMKIARMTVAQRMNLAMKGTREERAILVRDPNKLVSTSVLSSPKMTETEIEAIAKMGSVSEEILRIIGNTRQWVKNYNVALALVRNSKTPVAMSMNLLSRLTDKDLRGLSTNRNVPEIVRVTARKKVVIEK